MNITKKQGKGARCFVFVAKEDRREVGRAYLYLIYNKTGDYYYGLLEDVYVNENHRQHGFGTELVKEVIRQAEKNGCKYLMGTSRYSRPQVHQWYEKLGFKDYGKKFRMDF